MLKRCLNIVLIILFFTLYHLSYGQGDPKYEAKLKKEAQQLFEKKDFVAAMPLYSQLLSLYPKDPDYNFKFGTCLLFTDKDKEAPMQYLEPASSKPNVDPAVFFYLGRAHHLNYRFNEAIVAYNKFKEKAPVKLQEELMVDRQIEMCNNGKQLLHTITNLKVIEKKNMSANDFFRSYNLRDFGAKLIAQPEDFMSPIDEKKKIHSIMCLNKDADVIYYSSYGDKGKAGKDIYYRQKISNTEWGDPISVGDVINTPFDEEYPFLHPNGKTLYFCSQGHNSMGGYDIFKSSFNEVTGAWSTPVNVDFAINTPDDDILFITDYEEKTAYFASNRESVKGEITLYKVKLDRVPIDVTIIKGKFFAAKTKSAKIAVEKANNGELIGNFNTDKESDYTINIPNGGKFKFIVEAEGESTAYTGLVDIPKQDNLKVLKQEIHLITENGEQKLLIKNLFDKQYEALVDDPLLAANIIKEKASLEVNYVEETQIEKPSTPVVIPEEEEVASVGNMTNEDIVKMVFTEAKALEKDAEELKNQAEVAYVMANMKNNLAQKKSKQADELLENAETIDDEYEKLDQINSANGIKKESKEIAKEAVAAYNLAKRREQQAIDKQQEVDKAFQYAEEIEDAINANSTKALAILEQQKEFLGSQSQEGYNTEMINEQLSKKKEEANQTFENAKNIRSESSKLESKTRTLRHQEEIAKNEEEKKDILAQIEALEKEMDGLNEDADKEFKKAEQIQKEVDVIEQQAQVVSMIEEYQLSEGEAISDLSSEEKEVLAQQIVSIETLSVEEEIATTETSSLETPSSETDIQSETTMEETKEEIPEDYNPYFENKIAESNKIENEYQKEVALAAYYQQWADAVDSEMKILEEKLEIAETPKQQKAIKKLLAEKDEIFVTKQLFAEESKAKSELIKESMPISEQPVAVVAEVENPQEESPSSYEVEETQPTITSVYTEEYQAQYENTNQIKNEVDKTIAKAEITEQWVGKIKDEITELKEKEEQSVDETEKETITNRINQLEDIAEQKEAEIEKLYAYANEQQNETTTPATSSIALVETPEEIESTTTESTEETTVPVKSLPPSVVEEPEYIAEYKDRVATVDKMDNEYQKVLTKANINEGLIKELNTSINDLNKQQMMSNDENERKAIREKIKEYEILVARKEAENYGYQVMAEKIETSGVPTEEPLSNEEVTAMMNQNEVTVTEEVTTMAETTPITTPETEEYPEETETTEEEPSSFIEGETAIAEETPTAPIVKKNEISEKEYEQANTLQEEAVTLEDKATALRDSADNIKNKKKKEAILEEATSFDFLAEQKRTEASEHIAKAEVIEQEEVSSTIETEERTKEIAEETKPIRLTKEAIVEYVRAKKLKQEADSANALAEILMAEVVTITDAEEKETKMQEVWELQTLATQKQETAEISLAKAKELSGVGSELTYTSPVVSEEEELAELKEERIIKPTEEVVAVTKKPIKESIPQTKTPTTPVSLQTIDEVPPVLTTNVFEKTTNSLYNESYPIPINKKLPEGLVFKVQIGAFRNPIPQDLYNNFAPVMGENTGTGLTRYTAGLFKTLQNANLARDEIRPLGYQDAFVVAYFDGERISIAEARTLLKGITSTATSVADATAPTASPTTTTSTSTVGTTSASTAIAPAKEVSTIKGLFYTVQVGVYSKPVSADRLYNITPLNSETMANGNIKYTSGVYNNLNDANAAKNNIVSRGISDAFVIVYNNGKRIPVNEANDIVKQQGNVVLPASTKTTTTFEASSPVESTSNVIYKVQIGAYREQVPLEVVSSYLELSDEKIETHKDNNDMNIYTVGNYNNLEEANQLRDEIRNNGLTDAFVVAYRNGEKVPLNEVE